MVRRLDARGDSQLVIDQVMKNSHCRDPKMEAYCDEVRRLEDKFYGLELNHIARRYNETADELAKIASGRTTVPPDVFSQDLHQPSVKINDTPEPEAPSVQPEVPSAQSEAPSARPEAPSKNSHCRDPKMEAYCDEVRRLEDKFYGLELNHIARRYNETADELAKIASGRTTVPPDVFSQDLHQPSVKINDTPEPEAPSVQPEVPSAQSEAPSARPEAPSIQPKVPSAPEGETLHVEEKQSGVAPDQNWQATYLQYLHQGELPLDRAETRRLARRAKSFVLLGDEKELYHRSPSGILQRCISIAEGQELLQEIHSGAPLDRAETRRLARRAKSFVLLGDEKELYHRSPSGILQRCISIAEGQELLQEIHSGACGHHAAPRALVGNAF